MKSRRQWGIQRAIGFGISQSARFLRAFLYDGFNQDEQRRRVFDGVWAHVAGAGRGSFNVRFAQPSRDVRAFLDIFSPADIPPFTDRKLLAREIRTNTIPKLFLSNGSSEYWTRCASLIHTTPDGKADLDPMPTTRIYIFAGAQHWMGSLPPPKIAARNLGNINDYRCAFRALLIDMQEWIKDGKAPPPSHIPKLAKGQLVPIAKLAFPRIPGIQPPKHQREAYRLNFSTVPPKLGPAYPTFVLQVNADGNNLGAIDMPEIQVPLGTSTGWNLPLAGATGDLFALAGSYIPFPKTKTEREADHDPRRSIAERYPNESAYLNEIVDAAEHLVQHRLLLQG
ncbi:MAG: alpha/beta hydrolase domain-containing protein, partial [Limisphaerales bacterium]